MTASVPADRPAPAGIDTSTAHSARVYDFLLGGKDNYAADRVVAEGLLQMHPGTRDLAQHNRQFIGRTLDLLVGELGIDQVVDIGTGIPTSPAVHEIAQTINPGARVAYVDNDPIVMAHDRALLSKAPGVRTILGDVTTPEQIIDAPEFAGLIDWSRPVAVIFAALLHFVPDEAEPHKIMATFRDRLAPGSAIVISMFTTEGVPEEVTERAKALYSRSANPVTVRTKADMERFFTGFRVLEPGLVRLDRWRPAEGSGESDAVQGVLGGVGVVDA